MYVVYLSHLRFTYNKTICANTGEDEQFDAKGDGTKRHTNIFQHQSEINL